MASSKVEVKSRLIDAIDRCLAVQADHLAGLKSGCLAKINQWLEERQTIVARLRQSLTEAQRAGLDADLRSLLLEKIACILDTEKVIFSLAEEQRAALEGRLSGLRRGKRTLGRYGPTIKSCPPQFVSDNG